MKHRSNQAMPQSSVACPFSDPTTYIVTIEVEENEVFTIPAPKKVAASFNYTAHWESVHKGGLGGSKESQNGELRILFEDSGLKRMAIYGGTPL